MLEGHLPFELMKITWNKVVFSKKLNVILEVWCIALDGKFVSTDDGSVMVPAPFVDI